MVDQVEFPGVDFLKVVHSKALWWARVHVLATLERQRLLLV